MTRDRPINGISILKVSGISNDETIPEIGADEFRLVGDAVTCYKVNDFLCLGRLDALVIVAGEERTSVCLPEILEDGADGGSTLGRRLCVHGSNDIQPGNNSP